MTRCRSCDRDVPGDSRFCPRCGAALAAAPPSDEAASTGASPTRTLRGGLPDGAPPKARSPSTPRPSSPRPISGSPAEGRFLPGTMLAGRYRIFGLVGKGGMGEVYRADDVKLGQAVALKFLPPDVEGDAERLERFLGEVRIARQISHPNVCRVYDVGEVDGHHFLSMEFVDGEDLASLLRRIGRLPRDKALQIARQMCAGLAAAHEQGVLHRDLKPANVMIDGRGRARITDFGLARLANEIRAADVRAGTPAFMAPEQIAGQGVTVRSDLYSLGLVLYELCTGQPAFKGTTAAELARLKSETTPTSPGRIVEGFDPAVERVIMRCLERDPANRPASALAVAASLPGGDPLAAALAAGETPSPELVAEAGAVGGLRAGAAWACVAAIAVGIVSVVLLAPRTQMVRIVPLDKPPAVLNERARQILERLGYHDRPVDSVGQLEVDEEYRDHVSRDRRAPGDWSRFSIGPPFVLDYWYRQSPRPIVPRNLQQPRPWIDDPPQTVSGMAALRLDPAGRLRWLDVVPPERDTGAPAGETASAAAPSVAAPSTAPDPDWSALLGEAGLDPAALRRVEPAWLPGSYADRRAAWEGNYSTPPGDPFRVEAAAYAGRPVSFRFVDPWTTPSRMVSASTGGLVAFQEYVLITFILLIDLGGAFVAWRNVRLGRGDRKGAFRIAAFSFAASTLDWISRGHHAAADELIVRSMARLGYCLMLAITLWIYYLALEPYFRRIWPRTIVSWVRLLDGRFRDPLIGRDVLIGIVGGVLLALLHAAIVIVPSWFGVAGLAPDRGQPPFGLGALNDLREAFGILCLLMRDTLTTPMAIMVLLLLCRIVLRRDGIAIVAVLAIFGLSGFVDSGNFSLDLISGAMLAGCLMALFFRFGLLAMIEAQFVVEVLLVFPMTFDTSSWYAGSTLLAFAAIAALVVYGFRTALAGRSAFGDAVAPEARAA
jgi:Protein kinase domain